MILAKICTRYNAEGYAKDLDTDIFNLFLFVQGRIRFGGGTSGFKGENISGEWRDIVTGAANTEVAVPHGLNVVPVGRIVVRQDKAGSLYDSGTAWTSTNIYVKSDVANVTFKVFLLK